jgi:hypothetical protein
MQNALAKHAWGVWLLAAVSLSHHLPFWGCWLLVVMEVVGRSLAPDPPCEQGLAVVLSHLPGCGHMQGVSLICTRNPPYKQWLVGKGAGAAPFIIVVRVEAWLIAPSPPCKQVLAVVGDRCWGPSLICHHYSGTPGCHCHPTHDPPHEQLLMRLGWVVWPLCCHQLVAPTIHPMSSCS